jgi:hypothetical protein
MAKTSEIQIDAQQLQEILKRQLVVVNYTDINTGESKSTPRFCMRGTMVIKDGQEVPDKIYFDGNKNYNFLTKQSRYNVKSVVTALNIQVHRYKNLGAAEIKVYDNFQPNLASQLIYHYVKGVGDVLYLPWIDYLKFKRI